MLLSLLTFMSRLGDIWFKNSLYGKFSTVLLDEFIVIWKSVFWSSHIAKYLKLFTSPLKKLLVFKTLTLPRDLIKASNSNNTKKLSFFLLNLWIILDKYCQVDKVVFFLLKV